MDFLNIIYVIKNILRKKSYSVVLKSKETHGIEGEGIKNIISPHDGGYILIRWS